jgi:hypothetical protein
LSIVSLTFLDFRIRSLSPGRSHQTKCCYKVPYGRDRNMFGRSAQQCKGDSPAEAVYPIIRWCKGGDQMSNMLQSCWKRCGQIANCGRSPSIEAGCRSSQLRHATGTTSIAGAHFWHSDIRAGIISPGSFVMGLRANQIRVTFKKGGRPWLVPLANHPQRPSLQPTSKITAQAKWCSSLPTYVER